jgi:MFS family permease
MTPVNGRVSDIIGRKPLLYASVAVLMIFDVLCGAAKNITWWVRYKHALTNRLIVARAFAGLGGGSTVSLT